MDTFALLYFAKIWGLHVRGIGVCGYGYIHEKSVDMDMDMDMDGQLNIHGKPANMEESAIENSQSQSQNSKEYFF